MPQTATSVVEHLSGMSAEVEHLTRQADEIMPEASVHPVLLTAYQVESELVVLDALAHQVQAFQQEVSQEPSVHHEGHHSSVAEELADRKSTRLNSSHSGESRMPSSA